MKRLVEACPRCNTVRKLRVRTFSDQAMAALVAWGEVDDRAITDAICEECYSELRDMLIDRHNELIHITSDTPQSHGPLKDIKRVS